MSERIVTQQEAWLWVEVLNERLPGGLNRIDSERLAHTVATEPDRVRAAVGRAMQVVAQEMPDDGDCARAFVRAIRILKSEGLVADAIEKSADL